MLIVGPNCLGFTNYVDGVPLTFDDYKPIAATAPGVALIAQSGGLVNAIRDSIVGSGVRVTHNVSTGNEAVVTAEDFLDAIIDDAAVKTVILFVEQVRNPQEAPAARRQGARGRKEHRADAAGPDRAGAESRAIAHRRRSPATMR